LFKIPVGILFVGQWP